MSSQSASQTARGGSSLECLEDGATAERTEHMIPGQRSGVGLAELVVHQGPEVAHPHEPSLPPKPGTAIARIVV